MKKLTLAFAISLFAGSIAANPFIDNPDIWPGASDQSLEVSVSGSYVSDNDIYHGFEDGNLEIATSYGPESSLGLQPGVGDSSGSPQSVTTANDIYHGFEVDNLEL